MCCVVARVEIEVMAEVDRGRSAPRGGTRGVRTMFQLESLLEIFRSSGESISSPSLVLDGVKDGNAEPGGGKCVGVRSRRYERTDEAKARLYGVVWYHLDAIEV